MNRMNLLLILVILNRWELLFYCLGMLRCMRRWQLVNYCLSALTLLWSPLNSLLTLIVILCSLTEDDICKFYFGRYYNSHLPRGVWADTLAQVRRHLFQVSTLAPPPPQDGHCRGRYESYWNAFLFLIFYQVTTCGMGIHRIQVIRYNNKMSHLVFETQSKCQQKSKKGPVSSKYYKKKTPTACITINRKVISWNCRDIKFILSFFYLSWHWNIYIDSQSTNPFICNIWWET